MKKANNKFFNLKFLSRLTKKISSAAVSTFAITFASVFTVTQVVASDLPPPSLVPHRPLSPQLPTKTACQIIKVNQLINIRVDNLSEKYEI